MPSAALALWSRAVAPFSLEALPDSFQAASQIAEGEMDSLFSFLSLVCLLSC